jgi:type IV secretion system protein VirB9
MTLETITRAFLTAAMIVAAPALSRAESSPRAGQLDPRVRDVVYNKDNVVGVDASYGVSTMIILGDDEKIETLALGDSIAWKVEPNRRGNIIFIKPVDKDAHSNLNVVTNKRLYSFILRSAFRDPKRQIFKIRFRYPEDDLDQRLLAKAKERAAMPNMRDFNRANGNSEYGFKGSTRIKPVLAFDDGVKTWIEFRPETETPAIFIVDKDRNESLVNFRREGNFLVLDKVNFQWTLRHGDEVTCLFNLRLDPDNQPTASPALQRIGFDAKTTPEAR